MNHTAKLHRLVWGMCLCLLVLLSSITALIWTDLTDEPEQLLNDNIDTVRIQRGGFADIVMSQLAGQWQMIEPCTLPINEQRLKPLFDALQTTGHHYQAAEVDLDAAGLRPAQATVYLNRNRIDLGNTDLQGNRRYIQKGAVIEFAPEWILSLVNGGMSAFANLEPFGAELTQLIMQDQPPIDEMALENWKNLSAHQIVEFSALELAQNQTVQHAHAMVGSRRMAFEWYVQAEFTALRFADASCAYILPPDSISNTLKTTTLRD